MPKANLLRAVDNAGTVAGCLFIGLILAKLAVIVLIIWVIWHFISKYW